MNKSLIITSFVCSIFLFSCMSTSNNVKEEKATGPAIELYAKDAKLKTEGKLVYEKGDEKDNERDNIGWWESTDDEISWSFDVADGGEYIVIVRMACDTQFAGSEVGVTVTGQKIKFEVPDTAMWTTYADKKIGKIKLNSGSQTLVVKGIKLVNRFFGNLQKITLQKTN